MNIHPKMIWLRAVTTGVMLGLSTLAPSAQAEAYGSGWYGEVQASYGYEDNISRAAHSEPSDQLSTVSLGGGYSAKVGDRSQVILSSYATYTRHDEFDALDNLAVSAGMDFTVQPRAGFAAPWYNLTVNLTNFEYRDSESREGMLFDADLSASRRLSPTITGHLGLRYRDFFFRGKSTEEQARDAAFDVDSQEIYAAVDVQLRTFTYLFAEVVFRHGDVLSTRAGGPSAGRTTPATKQYSAETIDTIFDAPCERRCITGYAYRSRGDTIMATLGVAFPVSTLGVDMDVSAMWFDAEGASGTSYRDQMLKLGIIWNF